MSRIKIQEALKTVCKVDISQQLKSKINQDTLSIQKRGNLSSLDNSLAGWDNWIIYVYSPNGPVKLDELIKRVREVLLKNDIEVTHELGQEHYDETLCCYFTTISCRTPSIYDYY